MVRPFVTEIVVLPAPALPDDFRLPQPPPAPDPPLTRWQQWRDLAHVLPAANSCR